MPKSEAVEAESLPDDINEIFDRLESEEAEGTEEPKETEATGPDDEGQPEEKKEQSSIDDVAEDQEPEKPDTEPTEDTVEATLVDAPEGIDADLWQKIPADAQQAFVAREAGLQEAAKFKQDFGFINDYMARHGQAMAIHGMTPEQSLRQLMALNDLAQQNPAQYLQTFQQMTGFDIAGWVNAQQAEYDYLTPEQQQLQAMQQQMQQMQHQQAQAWVDQRLAAFAADPKNKFYGRPSVQAKMTEFINRKVTQDLDEAYQMAIWSLPEVREEMSKEAAGFTPRSTASAVEKAKRMTTVKVPEQSVSTPKAALSYKAETSRIFDKHGLN